LVEEVDSKEVGPDDCGYLDDVSAVFPSEEEQLLDEALVESLQEQQNNQKDDKRKR